MIPYWLYSWAPILVLIGIFALIAFRAYRTRVRQKEQLRKISSLFGFTFSDELGKQSSTGGQSFSQGTAKTGAGNILGTISGWEMKGRYNGVETRIYSKRISSGKRSSEYTCIDALTNYQSSSDLMITRERTLSRLGKAIFDMQDITSGNEELDRRVMIKGVPEHFVKRVVQHSGLQHELLQLFALEENFHVDKQGVHFQKYGVLTDEGLYRKLLDSMTRTASALETASAQ